MPELDKSIADAIAAATAKAVREALASSAPPAPPARPSVDPYKPLLDALASGAKGAALDAAFAAVAADGAKVEIQNDPVKGAFHYVEAGARSGRMPMILVDHPGAFSTVLVCVEDGFHCRQAKKIQ